MSYGLKKQISKLNPKMGFFGGPNKALANMGLKRPKLVSFWEGEQNVKEKERRRGRRWRAKIKANKVWNFGFLVWKLLWVWSLYGSHGILRFCMVSILSLNLGF